MTAVDLLVLPTASPGDVTATRTLAERGLNVDDVIAVVGKTEGNGCVNDFSRGLSAAVWEPILGDDAVTVFSGGTEGVLSPHVNLFVTGSGRVAGHDRGLVAAVGRTRDLDPAEIGRPAQIALVRDRVRELLNELAVTPDDVHMVLVKCPLLTSSQLAALRSAGITPASQDTYESMGRSRAASSLGIAVALGEMDDGHADEALTGTREGWSSRASASAGAELQDCHIMVLAESPEAANPLRAVHGEMADAIDLDGLGSLLDPIRAQGGTVRQIFVKAEADPTGAIRGHRHTMLTDSDINATRHARAAVGGLVAALKGDTAVYVSGGAEHQGPPGGGSVTVVYEVPARGAR